MDTPSIKDYIDAKDEALTAEVRQYYAMTEARLTEMDARVVNRLAEMETRLLRGQAEILKWCVGVVFAGMTINISVSAYLYSSTQSQISSLQTQMSATQAQMQELIREVRANSKSSNRN
jgi:urease accessory protein UreF